MKMPPFPSLTKTWHSEPYPAIDPTRPELSAKSKVVAISGGGGSIGGATALAFAKAGSTKIAVIGRREQPLQETKANVEKAVPGTNVLVVQGDVADADSVRGALGNIKKELGPIDILVCNAGYLSQFDPLEKAEPKEWWRGFEINVGGAFNCTRALLSNAGQNPILLEISTCPVVMPAMANASSYIPSKMAAFKVYETFAVENPSFEVVHVHPGVIYSELNVKSGITAQDSGNTVESERRNASTN